MANDELWLCSFVYTVNKCGYKIHPSRTPFVAWKDLGNRFPLHIKTLPGKPYVQNTYNHIGRLWLISFLHNIALFTVSKALKASRKQKYTELEVGLDYMQFTICFRVYTCT